MRRLAGVLAGLALAGAGAAAAETITVPMHAVDADGVGAPIGTVAAEDARYGLLLTPDLEGLSPGAHGFHVHRNPDCGTAEKNGDVVPGGAAGGHYDPAGAGSHEGPYGEGHLGDLPALVVGAGGRASLPVLAPRLTAADLSGRALIIHAGGDNYADVPKALGGGGPRVACGAVP